MASFQKDLPFILGAIFNTIAGVLSDRKKVKARHKIRLADFHEKAIKIGRVLGIEEDKISDILFQNRLDLSLSILESSSIAICLKELISKVKSMIQKLLLMNLSMFYMTDLH